MRRRAETDRVFPPADRSDICTNCAPSAGAASTRTSASGHCGRREAGKPSKRKQRVLAAARGRGSERVAEEFSSNKVDGCLTRDSVRNALHGLKARATALFYIIRQTNPRGLNCSTSTKPLSVSFSYGMTSSAMKLIAMNGSCSVEPSSCAAVKSRTYASRTSLDRRSLIRPATGSARRRECARRS